MPSTSKVGPETEARIRDYAVSEPGFTVPFAAWDLSRTGKAITPEAVRAGIKPLLKRGVIEIVEPAMRGLATVYAYVEPKPERVPKRRIFTELDAHRLEADLAQATGVAVPHTGGTVGPSGRPGRDRKKQEAGFRVKRARQGS